MVKKLAHLFLFPSLFFLSVFLPRAAVAQDVTTLSELEVDLWPEFDQPSMLVIYRITLPPEGSFPLDVELRIPTAAGAPNAVAARQANGTLLNLEYDVSPGSEWSQISFTATTPEVQIEYYDPRLEKDGDNRHFEYRWPGDYAVDNFSIQVQQPSGASNMRISPSFGAGETRSDGLVYYTSEIGSVSLGQALGIAIDYQKESDELSAPSVPVEPSGPLGDSTDGYLTRLPALPWFVGGMGLLLIAGGAFWYWRSGKEPFRSATKPTPRRRKSASQGEVVGAEDQHIYCHQCGKRALPGDRYCRVCGTLLRKS